MWLPNQVNGQMAICIHIGASSIKFIFAMFAPPPPPNLKMLPGAFKDVLNDRSMSPLDTISVIVIPYRVIPNQKF